MKYPNRLNDCCLNVQYCSICRTVSILESSLVHMYSRLLLHILGALSTIHIALHFYVSCIILICTLFYCFVLVFDANKVFNQKKLVVVISFAECNSSNITPLQSERSYYITLYISYFI